jgi:endonuclease/exonuclease/phosphatase family metal-dependent hydrolase
MKKKYYIAWWNLENLFDVFDSPHRPEWLQSKINSELQGWNESVLSKKVINLASIFRKMNFYTGPDIMGVCEVENLPVLERLVTAIRIPGRNYQVAHHDTNDKRGIDVAFIYDANKFTFENMFSHVVTQRNATRDLFQVNFISQKGNLLVLIGNHWHARIPNEFETEPNRIIAAETLSYWMERIEEIKGPDAQIVVMGDFNDEPYNRSISEYALSTHSEQKVKYAHIPRMLNLMYAAMGKGFGTFFYDNFPYVFDQFMLPKSMLKSTAKFKPIKQADSDLYQIEIVMMPEMMANSAYPKPKPFGRPSSPSTFDLEGYSDHWPISMMLEE